LHFARSELTHRVREESSSTSVFMLQILFLKKSGSDIASASATNTDFGS
jgi:hypothetical protein